jgi:hypothetical protein
MKEYFTRSVHMAGGMLTFNHGEARKIHHMGSTPFMMILRNNHYMIIPLSFYQEGHKVKIGGDGHRQARG